MEKEYDNSTSSSKEFLIGAMDNVAAQDEWTIMLKANRTIIYFKLNTGAQANVIPETVIRPLKEKP